MKLLMRALALLFFVAVATPAWAETSDWSAAMKVANNAYNQSNYDAARQGYIKAIQTNPVQPAAFRNLARTYFWQEQYTAAAHYYDHYLRLAKTAEDFEQVKAERKLAASRAANEVYSLEESQRLTRIALDRELDGGQAYTEGGGGAWGLYQTLLRTGYAEPDLAQIQAMLARSLLDEFDSSVLPDATDLVPRLSLEEWQLQAERLSAARKVTQDKAVRDLVDRRSTLVETGIAILTNQPEEAAELAKLARTRNPDLAFVAWYEIVGLTEAGKHREALEALKDFSRTLLDARPDQLDHLAVLRGLIQQRLEQSQDAASTFRGVLQR